MEVLGRWYGVRGRRFVRPALILAGGRSGRRVLAELDDKPWAAEDGEPWRATFVVDDRFNEGRVELSVAPDITVILRTNAGETVAVAERVVAAAAAIPRAKHTVSGLGGSGGVGSAGGAGSPGGGGSPSGGGSPGGGGSASEGGSDAPRPRASAGRPAGDRPGVRAPDPERLAARLTAAESALAHERVRRAETEAALDEQRAELRRATAELGRARAELELARAAEVQARDTAAELDAARRDNHAVQARYDALAAEHARALRDHGATREQLDALEEELRAREQELRSRGQELRSRDQALHSTRGELETERGRRTELEHHIPPPLHSDRPVNPSLRSNSWLLRLLAVLVLAAVLFTIWIVLHSTILH